MDIYGTGSFKGKIFKIHFFSLSDSTKDPLIIWLSGGPGCSSNIALFAENGPYRIFSQNDIRYNSDTWIQKASIVYIDQPLGTGFSYTRGPLPTNSSTAAVDIYNGLLEFFTLFPSYKTNDLYIAGDSYAGKFIPYFFDYLNSTVNPGIFNIKGAIIGNPMLNPVRLKFIYKI